MNFADLGLSDELLRAVSDSGYTEPTPIQAETIPPILMMKDIVGIAQTGTGKTASFVLPMIDILSHGRSRALMPRSLILEPTRELAAQVAENFEKYGKYQKLEMALLIGGVSMGDQMKALEKGVDVLIATPGRLMDLFERGKILLSGCDILVIDEADRMLDMGFIPDIETICQKLPANRQTLLFSATMPPPIKKLSDKFLTNPKHIEVARPATAATNIEQRLIETTSRTKKTTLKKLLRSEDITTAIVFSNRKTTVRDLQKSLQQDGFKAGQIHGDMSQPERMRELELFKSGEINILVASDVAARGLDVKGVSHVFNYDAPWHPDDYVHRIGRTGRAGANGTAITFVTPSDEEAIENIEKLTGQTINRGSATGTASPPRAKSKDSKKESEDAAAAADDKKDQDEKPKSQSRSRAKAKPESAETESNAPAPAKKATARKKPAALKTKKAEPKSDPKSSPKSQDEDADWNGPMPDFLSVKLGS